MPEPAHPERPSPTATVEPPDAAGPSAPSASPRGVPMPDDGPRHRMLETDRCAGWLGAEVLLAEPGRARLAMTLRPEMTNGFAIAHGGMIFALADTCFAMACNHPDQDDGTVTVASGADITFLRATRPGDELVAEAVEVARTGRSGVFDVTVTCDDEPVAVFRGRSRTVPAPSAAPADPAGPAGPASPAGADRTSQTPGEK